jgi:hypothetical protein
MRVDPAVLQAAMLDEIAERLYRIEAALMESRPKGAMCPIKVTVTGPLVLDFIEKPPHTSLFALTIYNDGPDTVFPSVNTYQKTTPLMPGENVKFEYVVPKIDRLYLDVEREGKKSLIRGFGVY